MLKNQTEARVLRAIHRAHHVATFVRRVTWKPLPDYGDLMTLEEFTENVRDGGFTDYDGTGYYASEHLESNVEVDLHRAGEEWDPEPAPSSRKFTHVMWYNR